MESHSMQGRESYERVLSRLNMINNVTTALTQTFDLDKTLNDILDTVIEVLGMELGAVFVLNKEDQGLTLVAHRSLPPEVVACEDGLKASRMLARHEDLHCKLAGPLRAKGAVNGLIFVGARTACPLLRQEVELLNTICSIAGTFVENVRLYQERLRDFQIERSMGQVAEEITSELELDRVLPKVVEISVELMGTDGGIIALLDESRNMVTYPYLHQLPGELASVTVTTSEGVSAEVITSGRPVVIDNYKTYPRAVEAFLRAGLTSIATVPIVSSDRVFGALGVLSINRTRAFSERDVALLTAIGRQAGIALEHAYLYENMRFYARRITYAQESERKRIARELHDDTIQSLIALTRHMEALSTSEEPLPEAAAKRIRMLQAETGEMIRRVRRFSQDLRPSILDDLGLLPTLEELTADLNRENGLEAIFRLQGERRRLSSEVELTLFRIAQEALNNVRKHAQAKRVLTTVVMSDGSVKLTVQDDGKGFVPPTLTDHPSVTSGLGLIGMHERARLLGGTLVVDSAPGEGTRVVVNVPV
jgi:signal transduction histidine kinase